MNTKKKKKYFEVSLAALECFLEIYETQGHNVARAYSAFSLGAKSKVLAYTLSFLKIGLS